MHVILQRCCPAAVTMASLAPFFFLVMTLMLSVMQAGAGGAHAAAVLLQLLRGCEAAGERVAALQGLVVGLAEGPKATRAAFAALPGWELLLLDLLVDGAPGVPPQVRNHHSHAIPCCQCLGLNLEIRREWLDYSAD